MGSEVDKQEMTEEITQWRHKASATEMQKITEKHGNVGEE